jgi:hypothetical protein
LGAAYFKGEEERPIVELISSRRGIVDRNRKIVLNFIVYKAEG